MRNTLVFVVFVVVGCQIQKITLLQLNFDLLYFLKFGMFYKRTYPRRCICMYINKIARFLIFQVKKSYVFERSTILMI